MAMAMALVLLAMAGPWPGLGEVSNASYVEVLSLLVFKAGLTNSSALSSWSELDGTACAWVGVECDNGTGMVSGLRLEGMGLSGSIGHTIADLVQLTTLSLAQNNLSGELPPMVMQIPALRSVNLSHNLLSGPLPATFGGGWLEELDLSCNALSGVIPPLLFDAAPRLRYLSLGGNQMLGGIPGNVSSCPALLTLNLSRNSLSGGVPAEVGTLLALRVLDLGFNQFGNVADLKNLSALQVLNVGSNLVQGNVPRWLGHVSSLVRLDLSHNLLSGSIPSGLGLLHSLQELSLCGNSLTGSLPTSLASLPLSSADLSDNRLTGPIPADLITPNLTTLNLSRNLLSTGVPVPGRCQALQVLDLSANSLTGPLPPQLAACSHLQLLRLADNGLGSSIPAEVGQLKLLRQLLLANNSFNGSIPAEVGGCEALQELDASRNQLSGSIPEELGNLSHLVRLDLSFNSLTGSVPPQLASLLNLSLLNFSNNRLEGAVPHLASPNATADYSANAGLCIDPSCSPSPSPEQQQQQASENQTTSVVVVERSRAVSVSAMVAISVAGVVAVGVVVVTLCSIRAQTRNRERRQKGAAGSVLETGSESGSECECDNGGRLVLFPRKGGGVEGEEVETRTVKALTKKGKEIGRGAFGTVFKGELSDGRKVAVKKLVVASVVKSEQEFEREMVMLGKIRHHNLVPVEGYYWSKAVQLVITEYVEKGNLYRRLHERGVGEAALEWSSRFNIAMGTALGLAHLHHACRPQVIHYDVKSSNILLGGPRGDEARISDFGLAKLLPMLDTYVVSSKFQSALGYMAPEFACRSLRIDEKCDIYGFGVLLLELVTGRRPVEYLDKDVVVLCDHVRGLLDAGSPMACLDPAISGAYAHDQVLPLIKLALLCTSQIPAHRPSMAQVIQILELIKPLLHLNNSSSPTP